mmetsp:Transcript_7537/g.16104  ORF Transcript_7537/g.16104 Transcript_7537/m.16104 type:complete len:106 (+) Transcript_7537:2889-3206(+)
MSGLGQDPSESGVAPPGQLRGLELECCAAAKRVEDCCVDDSRAAAAARRSDAFDSLIFFVVGSYYPRATVALSTDPELNSVSAPNRCLIPQVYVQSVVPPLRYAE